MDLICELKLDWQMAPFAGSQLLTEKNLKALKQNQISATKHLGRRMLMKTPEDTLSSKDIRKMITLCWLGNLQSKINLGANIAAPEDMRHLTSHFCFLLPRFPWYELFLNELL